MTRSDISDLQFTTELSEEIDVPSIRAEFSRRYGRGWQRKLARALGVAESTVSSWLRSGDIPKSVKIAIAILINRERSDTTASWHVVRDRDMFTITDLGDSPVGRIVADKVPTTEDALLIAAAPALKRACTGGLAILEELAEDESYYDILSEDIERIRAALERSETDDRA